MDFEEGSAFQMGLLDFEAGRSFLPLSSLSATLLPISSNFNQSANLSSLSSKFHSRVDSKFDVGSSLSPLSVSSAGLPPSDFSTPFNFEKSFTSGPFKPGGKPLDQFEATVSSFGEISKPSAPSSTRHAPIIHTGYQPHFSRPFLGQARSGRESSLSSSSLNNLEDVMEDTTVVYVSGADLDDSTSREGLHFGLQLCQGACCPGRVKFAWMVEEDFDTRGRVGSVSSDGYSTPGSSRDGVVAPGGSRDGVVANGNSREAVRDGVVAPGGSRDGVVAPAGTRDGVVAPGGSRDGVVAPGSSRDGVVAPGGSRDGVSNHKPVTHGKEVTSNYRAAPRPEIIRKDNGTIIIPSAMPGLVPRTPPKSTVDHSGFYSSSDTQFSPTAPPSKTPAAPLLDKSITEDESEATSEVKSGNPNKWAKIKRKGKKGKK